MKRTIAILAIIIGFTSGLKAQGTQGGQMPDPKVMAQKSADQLSLKLSLSPAQKEKVQNILIAHNAAIVEALKENQNNPQAMDSAASKLMAQSDAKINLVLSTGQKKLFKEIKEKKMAEMKPVAGAQTGPAH